MAGASHVQDMYERFPYPSPSSGSDQFKELANLLKLYERECQLSLAGLTMLDAGCGSGHRLIECARAFAATTIQGVDFSRPSLKVAAERATALDLTNIRFQFQDLLDPSSGGIGEFDIVTSMGVLGHTVNPPLALKHVAANLTADGVFFAYLYGALGSAERIRQKEMLAILNKGGDFESGIQLYEDLQLEQRDYGWTNTGTDEATRRSFIVDACLNTNDSFYTIDSLVELFKGSGLLAFSVFGVTMAGGGALFDISGEPHPLRFRTADFSGLMKSSRLKQAWDNLDLIEKHQLLDRWLQPNGYTLIAVKSEAGLARLSKRLANQAIRVA